MPLKISKKARRLFPLKIRLIIYILFFLGAFSYYLRYQTIEIPFIDSVKNQYCKLQLPKTQPFLRGELKQFTTSKTDVDDFYRNLGKIVEKPKFNQYQKFFNQVKDSSPESFYVIREFSKKQPEEFELGINNWTTKLNNESAAILVHEFTHSAQYPCFLEKTSCKRYSDFEVVPYVPYSSEKDINGFNYEDNNFSEKTAYWISGKAYTVDFKESELFAFEDIPEKLPTLTPMDVRDNEEGAYASQDMSLILGEINAYTKSSRIIREMNCSQITKRLDRYFYAQNLARQLLHLGQYIEYASKNYPTTYSYIIQNKAIAFMTLRLEALAREELGIVLTNASTKDKINHETSPEGIRFNLDLFDKKKAVMDKFYSDSGVIQLKDKLLSPEELKNNNINLSETAIN